MQTVSTIAALRATLSQWRREGRSVALVPTMGNLHAGHLALVRRAQQLGERTVVSIFVNPTQFVAGEDYQGYPRTLSKDSLCLAELGPEVLFAPAVEEMYPAGTAGHTRVEVPGLGDTLCGEFRPGHFTGVATVVTKLLNAVQPDIAVFGEKDYQQLLVIRRLVTDLCLPVEIHGLPTVREADGLALSSRNSYLSPEEREIAPALYRTLQEAAERLRGGEQDLRKVERAGLEALTAAGLRPEYFAVRRGPDLTVPAGPEENLVILAAAWLGKARLIDNIALHHQHCTPGRNRE